MSVRSLRLPAEIIGEVVSLLSDDKEALLSCALVSQDWISESRLFLFRHIDIRSRERLQSFVTNVLRSECLCPYLTSTHDLWIEFEFFDGTCEGEPKAVFLEIAERLPNLRTMGLTRFPRGVVKQNVHPPPSLLPDFFPALGQFASLYQLYLDYCAFTSFGELKNVLVALPALSSLSMDRVSYPDPGETDQRSALAGSSNRPTLSYLSVRDSAGDMRILYDWLSNTATQSTLRELSLHFDHIVAGWQMIAGTSLTALTLRDMESDGSRDVFADPRFAQLPQRLLGTEDVKLLRVHAYFPGGQISWGEIASALRPFTSARAVHVLRLCCCPEHHSEDDGQEFYTGLEVLTPVLEAGAFAHLKAIVFVSFLVRRDEQLPEKYDQFSAWLQRKLPSLHERGVVRQYVYNAFTAFGPSRTFEDLEELDSVDFPYCSPML